MSWSQESESRLHCTLTVCLMPSCLSFFIYKMKVMTASGSLATVSMECNNGTCYLLGDSPWTNIKRERRHSAPGAWLLGGQLREEPLGLVRSDTERTVCGVTKTDTYS